MLYPFCCCCYLRKRYYMYCDRFLKNADIKMDNCVKKYGFNVDSDSEVMDIVIR